MNNNTTSETYETIETDVLIVGGGGAGSRAAIEAYDHGAKVLMIVKGELGHSGCTPYVGTNAAVGPWGDPDDTPASAMYDLLAHGGFLGNQELIKILAEESPDRIVELQEWGTDFQRDEDGSIAVMRVAAHTYGRNLTLKPSPGNNRQDGYPPGLAVMETLLAEISKRAIDVMNEVVLVDLLMADSRVVGATAIDRTSGKRLVLKAKATILATGTYSHVYSRASVSPQETGDGQAAAFRVGAELIDMENTQFIPSRTGIPPGGVLVNVNGEPFLEKYGILDTKQHPKEDTVFAIGTEIREGRGSGRDTVFVDMTGPSPESLWPAEYEERLKDRGSLYPGFNGDSIDLSADRFETAPLAHTTTGGVRINERCETTIAGLYAAGAVAGGVYGHARPEGFTVMITLVFGRRAGLFAAKAARAEGSVPWDEGAVKASFKRASLYRDANEPWSNEVKSQLQKTMYDHAWVIKDGDGLETGLQQMRQIAQAVPPKLSSTTEQPDGFSWTGALEVTNLLLTAELMLMGCIERKESRGAFFRADYPETDDENWLKNILYRHVDGRTVIDVVPVDLKYCGPHSTIAESIGPGVDRI